MKKNERRGIAKLLLVTGILLATVMSFFAAPNEPGEPMKFTDVPDKHWGKSTIDAITAGGLMHGYGNGRFGPDDTFCIDQMATIIANINGYPEKAQNGYWAYGAVDYCVNTLKCLPDLGKINNANYGKPCTRELAIYMMVMGPGPVSSTLKNVDTTDIPDYNKIDDQYKDAVLAAYRYGMLVGVDTKGTFNPKGMLTRAAAATVIVRAGYVSAADVATKDPKALNAEAAYAAVKSIPGVTWKEREFSGVKYLTAQDRKYGGIEFYADVEYNNCGIDGYELPTGMWFDSAGNYIDVNGKQVEDCFDKNGKMVTPTAFGYEARRLVKEIMYAVYNSDLDATEKAYSVFKDVFDQKVYESTTSVLPSAYRWVGGRELSIDLTESDSFVIRFGKPNDIERYNREMAEQKTDVRQLSYIFRTGSKESAVKAYELDRW